MLSKLGEEIHFYPKSNYLTNLLEGKSYEMKSFLHACHTLSCVRTYKLYKNKVIYLSMTKTE